MSECPQEISHSGDSEWCQTEQEPASKCAQGKAQERIVGLLTTSQNIRWRDGRSPYPWEVREVLVLLGMARSSLSSANAALSSISGALVDAGCSVGDQAGWGELVRGLAGERDEAVRRTRQIEWDDGTPANKRTVAELYDQNVALGKMAAEAEVRAEAAEAERDSLKAAAQEEASAADEARAAWTAAKDALMEVQRDRTAAEGEVARLRGERDEAHAWVNSLQSAMVQVIDRAEDVESDCSSALKRSGGFREGHEADQVASAAEVAGYRVRAEEVIRTAWSALLRHTDPLCRIETIHRTTSGFTHPQFGVSFTTVRGTTDKDPICSRCQAVMDAALAPRAEGSKP